MCVYIYIYKLSKRVKKVSILSTKNLPSVHSIHADNVKRKG